jgi:hypothetical protein
MLEPVPSTCVVLIFDGLTPDSGVSRILIPGVDEPC